MCASGLCTHLLSLARDWLGAVRSAERKIPRAVLLQQNAPNQALFGEEGGVLALLTATSYYKRREPQARAPRS